MAVSITEIHAIAVRITVFYGNSVFYNSCQNVDRLTGFLQTSVHVQ